MKYVACKFSPVMELKYVYRVLLVERCKGHTYLCVESTRMAVVCLCQLGTSLGPAGLWPSMILTKLTYIYNFAPPPHSRSIHNGN